MKLLLSIVLFPITILYLFVITLRNLLFDWGVLSVRRFSVPILSVGNISAGGTGKTPHVKKIVELLLLQKKRVCIVSRGYGGIYGGRATRVEPELENAAQLFGDEPTFFAKNLPAPVYVAHDRSTAVDLCVKEAHPEVIVSDDSFQHRWMGRALDIVLLDSTDQNCWLIPMGRYREPLSSLKRAQLVILTKTNLATDEQKNKWHRRLNSYGFSLNKKNLFESSYEIEAIEIFRGVEPFNAGDSVFLASSIARPESFEHLLAERCRIVKHIAQKDHFAWNQKDIDHLEMLAVEAGVKKLLITEKDAVKMENLIFQFLQVYIVKLQLQIQPNIKYENIF